MVNTIAKSKSMTKGYGIAAAVALLFFTYESGHAELYKYIDEHGELHVTTNYDSVPQGFRSRVTVIKDEENRSSPQPAMSGEKNDKNQVHPELHDHAAIGPAAHAPSQEIAGLSAPPLLKSHSDMSQGVITKNTDTNLKASPENNFVIGVMQRTLSDKFKNVKDASQLPAVNGEVASDCTKYKKILSEDTHKMDTFMKETDEKRKRGSLGFIDKVQAAIKGMKLTANFIYDTAFTPKNCSEEFERENKEMLEAIGN